MIEDSSGRNKSGEAQMDVVCQFCKRGFSGQIKRNFFGLLKFHCPYCNHETLYPMTVGFRVAYWTLLALICVVTIFGFLRGEFVGFSLLSVLVIVALIYDYRTKKQVRQTEKERT